jgi:hypothetical protein
MSSSRLVGLMFVVLACSFALAVQALPRSRAERSAFVRENPCPSTGLRRGACPGYEVDHIEALCAGGKDEKQNMQWLTITTHRIKTRQDVRMCRAKKRLEE